MSNPLSILVWSDSGFSDWIDLTEHTDEPSIRAAVDTLATDDDEWRIALHGGKGWFPFHPGTGGWDELPWLAAVATAAKDAEVDTWQLMAVLADEMPDDPEEVARAAAKASRAYVGRFASWAEFAEEERVVLDPPHEDEFEKFDSLVEVQRACEYGGEGREFFALSDDHGEFFAMDDPMLGGSGEFHIFERVR